LLAIYARSPDALPGASRAAMTHCLGLQGPEDVLRFANEI
jgi:hypothetical protein